MAVSGCGSRPYKMQSSYNDADFIQSAKGAVVNISGQAFSRTVGGDVKYGAGVTVSLFRSNKYTDEIVEAINGGWRYVDADPKWQSYIIKTTADANGNFVFKNVAPGVYYLETVLTWQYATQYGLKTTGGTIRSKIQVTQEQDQRFILTN